MRRAITLSSRQPTHPNPRVGAVVLDASGVVVAEGFHLRPGEGHAEAIALETAGERARGGTLVVSLEPCVHRGRTPPCADAVIEAGVARVVVGAIDPDERVSGAGIERLRAAGIEVRTGVLSEEVEANDPGYFHHRRTGRPRITLKVALTLDGQTAGADGTSRWITSEEARMDAHRLRAASDAVMVGAGTMRSDDPLLTVRLEGYEGPQPRPVVVAGSRPLPTEARLWDRQPVVIAPGPLRVPAGEVIEAPDSGAIVDLEAGIRRLGMLGLLDVLVEGGAALAASLWERGLVDAGVWYLAGKMAGGVGRPVFDRIFSNVDEAAEVEILDLRRVGPDVRIEWRS